MLIRASAVGSWLPGGLEFGQRIEREAFLLGEIHELDARPEVIAPCALGVAELSADVHCKKDARELSGQESPKMFHSSPRLPRSQASGAKLPRGAPALSGPTTHSGSLCWFIGTRDQPLEGNLVIRTPM